MKKVIDNSLLVIFLAIEFVFYLLIVFIPNNLPQNIISYIPILLCVVFMIFSLSINRTKINFLMFLAIVFTAIADLFLVLLEASNREIAMTSFCITQILYFVVLVLKTTNKKEILTNIIMRATILLALEILGIIIIQNNYSYLVFISIFYFANLFTNIIFAFVHSKTNLLFALGLLLFLGCDIIIGLDYLCDIMSIDTNNFLYLISHSGFNISWCCYLPSQVYLVLSTVFNKSNKQIN